MGSLTAGRAPRRPLRASLAWPATVVVAALGTAALTMLSFQAGTAVVVVVAIGALYVWRRDWGVMAMFALWLLAPGVRRLFQTFSGYVSADPLALAPFVATALIVALELRRTRMSESSNRLLLAAAGGFLIGLPVGLFAAPAAAAFALFAYVTGLGAAVIGYREARRFDSLTLRRVLTFALPAVALYGIAQHELPLTRWDILWLETVDIPAIGDPDQQDELRIFSTLNSPATLAGAVAIGLLWHMGSRRPGPGAIVMAVVLLATLALTSVRSAWLALVVGALAHVAASRGRTAARLAVVAIGLVVGLTSLAAVDPTASAIVERASTFGELEDDTSAQARVETPKTLFAGAASAPFGIGLGQAGEATRLGASERLRASDNTYLALLYQSGLAGLLLVVVPVLIIVGKAWRATRRRGPGQEQRATVFALLLFFLVFMASGDQFYGVMGVIFWFLAGTVLGDADRLRQSSSTMPSVDGRRIT